MENWRLAAAIIVSAVIKSPYPDVLKGFEIYETKIKQYFLELILKGQTVNWLATLSHKHQYGPSCSLTYFTQNDNKSLYTLFDIWD